MPGRTEHGASSGNQTRAARVAGEHSTTEPTMLTGYSVRKILIKREKNRKSGYKLSSLFYTKWNLYYNYVLKVNVMNDCTVMLVLLFYTVLYWSGDECNTSMRVRVS